MDAITDYETVLETVDHFNHEIAVFKSLHPEHEALPYWAEQPRKDVISDFMSLDDATELYNKFLMDTEF